MQQRDPAAAHTAFARRMNIYANIHKGLRTMMTDTLATVGCVDVYDRTALDAACTSALELCDACSSHLFHENKFVHPAMEVCRPGSTAHIAAEHDEHLAAIAEIRAAVSELCDVCRSPANEQAALELYRKLALFVGENFVHMHVEELEHNRVLWACYSDEELQKLEGRIVAAMPLAESLKFMRWMVPAMNPAERAMLLTGIQSTAPARVLSAVLDVVQPYLSQRDWGQLIRALVTADMPAPESVG